MKFTPSRDGDSPVLPDLLDQIPEDEPIGTVTPDGAYDARHCHTASSSARPRRSSDPQERTTLERGWASSPGRNDLRATRHFSRAFRKRWTGYHLRSRIEARVRCLKAFGERLASRTPDRQPTEVHIRVALMNRFSASAPPILSRGMTSLGKGDLRLKPEFCNMCNRPKRKR